VKSRRYISGCGGCRRQAKALAGRDVINMIELFASMLTFCGGGVTLLGAGLMIRAVFGFSIGED